MKFFDKISPDGGGEDLAGSAIYFVSILYCLYSAVCCSVFFLDGVRKNDFFLNSGLFFLNCVLLL